MARANLQSAVLIILLNLFLTLGYSQIDWHAHLGGLVGGLVLGAALDGIGSVRIRSLVRVGTVVGIALAVLLLVGFRTSQLRSQYGVAQLQHAKQCLIHPNLTC